jgi:Tol biopolymer transport system component
MNRWVLVFALATLFPNPVLAEEEKGNEEQAFLTNPRQLTFEGKRAGEAYFSPDGKRLIFQAEREADNPFYQIYILSLETGDLTRVTPGMGKTTCSFFHPVEDRVLFASTHLDPDAVAKQKQELQLRAEGKQRRYAWDYDETYDIFTSKPDGSDMIRLTSEPGYDAECAFSPDGAWIVFSSNRTAYPIDKLSKKDQDKAAVDLSYFADIYVMKSDGTGVKRLTTEPGYDGGPFFTPDGKRIVWRRFAEDGAVADVYVALDGSDVRRVTDFGAMSWAPFFHPSGEYWSSPTFLASRTSSSTSWMPKARRSPCASAARPASMGSRCFRRMERSSRGRRVARRASRHRSSSPSGTQTARQRTGARSQGSCGHKINSAARRSSATRRRRT